MQYKRKYLRIEMREIKLVTDHISWESSHEDGKADAAVAQKSTNHRVGWPYFIQRISFTRTFRPVAE